MEYVKGSGQEVIQEQFLETTLEPTQQALVDTMVGFTAERAGLGYAPENLNWEQAVTFANDIANREVREQAAIMEQMLIDGEITPEELLTFDLDQNVNNLVDQATKGVVEDIQLQQNPDDQELESQTPQEVALYAAAELEALEAEMNSMFQQQGFMGKAFDIGSYLAYSEEEVIMNNLKSAFDVDGATPPEVLKNISFYIQMSRSKTEAHERINLLKETLTNADFIQNYAVAEGIYRKIRDYPLSEQMMDTAFLATLPLDAVGVTSLGAKGAAKLFKIGKQTIETANVSKLAQSMGAENIAKTGPLEHGAMPEDISVINGIDGRSLEEAILPTVDDAELEAAAEFAEEELRSQLGARFPATYQIEWKDIPVNYEKGTAGNAQVSMYIGTGADHKQGFKFKASAESLAKVYPGSEVVQGDGGRYWLKFTKDVNPYKAHTIETSPLKPRGSIFTNIVSRLGSADLLSDDKIGNAFRHLTFDARTKLRDNINELYEPILQWNRKNKKEAANLKMIMLAGQKSVSRDGKGRGIWWTKEEFARGWTENPAKLDEAWEQYQSFKRIDELMYTKLNQSLRTKMIREGYANVSANGIDDFVGRQVRFDLPNSVYDPVLKKMVKPDGYTVYRTGNLGRREFIGVKKPVETALPQFVINKTEGGRISYGDNEWFVKADPGEGRRKIAIAAGGDKDSGEAFSKAINDAGKTYTAWKSGRISDTDAEAAIEAATAQVGAMNLKQFEAFVKEYKLVNKDGSFRKTEVMYEGASGTREVDTDVMEEVASVGSLYSQRRTGKVLRGFADEEAPLMDPLAAQYASMQRTINVMTVDGYLARTHRSFRENARGLLHPDMNGKSDAEVFNSPRFKDGLSPDEQEKVNRLMLLKSTTDRTFQQATQYDKELMKWFRGTRLEQPVGYLLSKNPVDFMRGATFDMYLGMFSIRQAWLQASGMINTTAVAPISALRSASILPAVRMALVRPDSVEAIGRMVEKTSRLMPGMPRMTADEFVELVGDVTKSGKTIIGKAAAELGTADGRQILKDAGGLPLWHIQSIRSGGRVFFNEGERLNRLFGYLTARDEFIRANGKKPTSVKDFGQVSDRAEVLTMRMTSASKAAWNEGVAALPTQFWNYQVRWFENVMGNRLTAGERIRLAATTLGLYGTAGTIGGVPALQAIGLLPEETPDDVRRAAHFGLMTTFVDQVYETLGMDPPGIDYSELGPSLAENGIVEAIWAGMNGVEDVNLFTTVMGASASAFSRVAQVTGNMWQSLVNADPDDIGGSAQRFLGHLASITKSGEDYTAAYMIWRYNTDQNWRQGLKRSGIDNEIALYKALGLKTTNDSFNFDFNQLRKFERSYYRGRVNDVISAAQQYRAGMISRDEFVNTYLDNLRAAPREQQGRFFYDVDRGLDGRQMNMNGVIMKSLEMEQEFGGLIGNE